MKTQIIQVAAYLLSMAFIVLMVLWCFKVQAKRDARKKAGLPQKKYAALEVFNSVVSDIAKESAKQTNRKIAAKKSAAKRKKIKW